ncbi:carbamoyl-phosphate synthase (glutamine-hydrolyzing) large subunit, partial [Candidatus Woesearchaeota archaeon]|nr:carbamoyl-phosphate synthase (glutamine-hydrolyzing) large subunit [Candidatus Woesearchaeota archaeon]
LKALREEGITTVLVNPNIATIQTSEGMADKIYFLPITPEFVEKVIEKEKPDGILLSFGGQTALNCGVKLDECGILKKHNVEILGTPIEAIRNTEDRGLFTKKLKEINVKVPEGISIASVDQAIGTARSLGFPVMIRAGYALGGQGSGEACNEEELKQKALRALNVSPSILIEKYFGGWKEIEYEIVRDRYDNCIAVCNMENVDPLGIHTGESIVVAPSQTLNSHEYHVLRSLAIKVIRHLGIVGECNVQFALSPTSDDYRVIEVNARLSRSSALASKATGYPLAFVAAKLALGYALTEIQNSVTKVTKACFEPALDYIVVKMPRWDLDKFKNVHHGIGTEMKSVGEVMAIGRTFEETIQKAVRMLGIGVQGLLTDIKFQNIENELKNPTDKRLYAIAEALHQGITVDRIHELTKIDRWFLYKIQNVIETAQFISQQSADAIAPSLLRRAKQQGFSDIQIAHLLGLNDKGLSIRQLRKKQGILPVVKQIDTLGAEYEAKTNYLYLTYNGEEDDIQPQQNSKIVLGSGHYRIGSSVEFDWCCVNTIFTLKKLGCSTTMINYNPETVSTDYDVCDRLYFEELSIERVLDIVEKENGAEVIVSMGGQISNDIALDLEKLGVRVKGTSPYNIDQAENRHKFSLLLHKLNIDQPEWCEARSLRDVEAFAERVSYPLLIRPSYVLSGAAMSVASNRRELELYLKKAAIVSNEHPVVVSKFITEAKEIEIDAVASDGLIISYAISEHIENAGVHSGDATLVLPPQYTYIETVRKIKEIAKLIAAELKITGPFNIQFLAKQNQIKVIECNLRASRSFPFISKITRVNFIELATKAIMGEKVMPQNSTLDLDYVGVKAPQFSFSRLHGADPLLGVEMASTGEVACIGRDIHEALLKSLLSVGFKMPEKGILLSTGPIKSKADMLESIRKISAQLYATSGTHVFLAENGIASTLVSWPDEKEPNALSILMKGEVDLVINIPKNDEERELTNDYLIRRKAADLSIPLLTNTQIAKLFLESLSQKSILEIKEWREYSV